MIRVPLDFFRTMLRMQPAWWAWIGALTLANGVAPLFFLPERTALVTPGTALRFWAVSVIALNAESLTIDIADLVRSLRGERSPALTLFED